MKMIKIIDFLDKAITKRQRHPAGYLLLPDCVIARSGMLQYADVVCEDGKVVNNGNVIWVYRPAKALRKCVKHFNNIPVTKSHPPEQEVTPNSVRKVVVGIVGSNARIVERPDDEVEVVADIMVHDQSAINEIEEKNYEELSAGYTTAYRNKRGTTKGGDAYEAIQFYLMPNHVALVENGRCGSECRVCDSKHKETSESKMKIKNKKNGSGTKYRYFLATDAKGECGTEISKDVFEQLSTEEDADIEELEDGKDIQLEDETTDEDDLENKDLEKETVPSVEDEDEDPDLEKETVPGVEDEDEDPDLEENIEDEGEDTLFEVELEDGVVGKMDKVAYDYFKRYMDMQKKGDSMNTTAEILLLSSQAGRIFGPEFAVDSYIADGKFDSRRLKKAVIKKVMPEIVITSLKNDAAIDSMFKCAVASSKRKTVDWAADMGNLASSSKAVDSAGVKKSSVQIARENRLLKISGKKI